MLSKHMYGHRAHAEALKVPEVLIKKKHMDQKITMAEDRSC